MLKVYCDECGQEIKEDKDAKDEGFDWFELTIKRQPQNIVDHITEHICEKCRNKLMKKLGYEQP